MKRKIILKQFAFGGFGAIVGLLAAWRFSFFPFIGLYICGPFFMALERYYLADGGDPEASVGFLALIISFLINEVIYALLGWFAGIKLIPFVLNLANNKWKKASIQ